MQPAEIKAPDATAPGSEEFWVGAFAKAVEIARKKYRIPLAHTGAEDLAMSAVRTLMRRVGNGDLVISSDADEFAGLLYAVVRNKVAQAYRRHGSDPTHRAEGEPLLPSRADQGKVQAELDREIRELFEGLDAEQQTIAWLVLEGYTQKQIGFHLGVSSKTVKRRWAEIREFFRNQR